MTRRRRASYGVQHFMAAAEELHDVLTRQLRRAEKEQELHAESRATLVQQATAARQDLARSLLPGLVPPLVQKARDLTGYAPWRTDDPIRQMEGDRAGVLARIAAIEADPLFVQNELLFHPRTGTHTRELAEVSGHLATQDAELERLATHPRFTYLIEVGYGTSGYAVPFWRLSYYDDWKAGDEILEANPGRTWDELRRAWNEALSAAYTLRGESERLTALVARGRALWDEHAALKRRLDVLPGEHLVSAQARLVEHVMTSDAATMRSALARDPPLVNLYLRASALDAKVRYVDHLFQEQVAIPREGIVRQLEKLARDRVKYARPKYAYHVFDAASFDRRFGDKRAAWEKRWVRYRTGYAGIAGWDDWDHVPDDEFVWWDVMTDGRPEGETLDDVARFRRRHGRPSWIDGGQRGRGRDDADDGLVTHAAAAAAMHGGSLGGGAGSLDHDPS